MPTSTALEGIMVILDHVCLDNKSHYSTNAINDSQSLFMGTVEMT